MRNEKKYITIEVRKFVEKEIKHLWDKVNIILTKNAKALKEARRLMDLRLKEMNEVRAQLDRQVRTFVSVEKHEGDVKAMNQKIEGLSKLVYIGLGVWVVLQIIISVVLLLIFKA